MNEVNDLQQQLDAFQSTYHRWCVLLPELEADAARWQEAAALAKQMEAFYSEGVYRQLREAEEAGIPLNTQTAGEYSVLSEDAVWNALGDFQSLAWQRLRSATDALDPETENQFPK